MSWRSELEERFTVKCEKCGYEVVDPAKRPAQRYLLGRACAHCGHVRPRR
jgi:hypothetical protein